MVGELAQQHGATFLLATPTFCSHYTRKCSRKQFGSLRYVLVGAEKLRDSAAEEFRNKFGIDLLAGYGATELGPAAAVNTPNVNGQGSQCGTRAGSVGRPLPGTSMRVINAETFAPLPPGEQGMLLVKSPSRMQGYYGEPQKTRGVLHDGFYVTGDLARIDEDGFVFITDRLARFSKIGGEMVPHLKIEEVASEVLTDAGCFVTGVSDEKRGERLVLLYTSTNIEAAEILNHLQAANLPPLWIPKRDNIYFVDSIPVLGTGKVDLAGARALAATRVTEKLDPVSSPHRAVGA